MSEVVYAKLVTGEQLLATVKKTTDDVVVLVDPLELTFSETDSGASYIYLSRYSPFMASTTVRFSREHLLHCEKAMESATVYYERSLEYVRRKSDVSFRNGVEEATSYIEDLNESAKPPSAKREESSTDDLADMLDLITGKATVH